MDESLERLPASGDWPSAGVSNSESGVDVPGLVWCSATVNGESILRDGPALVSNNAVIGSASHKGLTGVAFGRVDGGGGSVLGWALPHFRAFADQRGPMTDSP